MTHNKGKKYILCKECDKKRYCRVERLGDYQRRWTCSKGHTWALRYGPVALITEAALEQITPKLKDLFDRDNIFLRYLRSRK